MRPIAVAVVLLSVRDSALSVLLVRRPGNQWGLPSRELAAADRLEGTARDVLHADASASPSALEQLFTFDIPDGRLTVAYLALATPERSPLTPGPGVVEVRWFAVPDVPPLPLPDSRALAVATERLRGKAAYAPIALALLSETFTLGELQAVYEAALGISLDTRNFRRDVLAAGLVEDSGSTRPGPGRPAKLYRAGGGLLSLGERERRLAGSLTPAGPRGGGSNVPRTRGMRVRAPADRPLPRGSLRAVGVSDLGARVASHDQAADDDLPITWPFRLAGLCLILSLAYFCAGWAVEDLEYTIWGHHDVTWGLAYVGIAATVLGAVFNIYREHRRRRRLA